MSVPVACSLESGDQLACLRPSPVTGFGSLGFLGFEELGGKGVGVKVLA